MTEQVFLTQFNNLPEGIKQEILSFAEYLVLKYEAKTTTQVSVEKKQKPVPKPLKAGFLKGTFILADDFDAPLEDFKAYMQ